MDTDHFKLSADIKNEYFRFMGNASYQVVATDVMGVLSLRYYILVTDEEGVKSTQITGFNFYPAEGRLTKKVDNGKDEVMQVNSFYLTTYILVWSQYFYRTHDVMRVESWFLPKDN